MKNKAHITAGAIVSILMIIVLFILHFLGKSDANNNFISNAAIMTVGIAASCVLYGKSLENNLTFGNAFAFGFRTAVIIILIQIVWLIVVVKIPLLWVLDKDFAAVREKLNGSSLAEKNRLMVLLISKTLFQSAIIGAVGAFLGAILTKKTPQPTTIN